MVICALLFIFFLHFCIYFIIFNALTQKLHHHITNYVNLTNKVCFTHFHILQACIFSSQFLNTRKVWLFSHFFVCCFVSFASWACAFFSRDHVLFTPCRVLLERESGESTLDLILLYVNIMITWNVCDFF